MPKMKVIKSIYIDSAPEKIYPIISDLNNWQEWSPWVIAEPRAQLNVSSDGKFHEWDGDIIGAGNLKIQDEVENQSVTMALNFLKPWKSKAVTSFTLKKKKKYCITQCLLWQKKELEAWPIMTAGIFLIKCFSPLTGMVTHRYFYSKLPSIARLNCEH